MPGYGDLCRCGNLRGRDNLQRLRADVRGRTHPAGILYLYRLVYMPGYKYLRHHLRDLLRRDVHDDLLRDLLGPDVFCVHLPITNLPGHNLHGDKLSADLSYDLCADLFGRDL